MKNKSALIGIFAVLIAVLCACAFSRPARASTWEQALERAYPGWSVWDECALGTDGDAHLACVEKDGQTATVILERSGGEFAVTAANDRLFPPNAPQEGRLWMNDDHWSSKHPFLWYMADNSNEFLYIILEDSGSGWQVVHFEMDRPEDKTMKDTEKKDQETLSYSVANAGTALHIYHITPSPFVIVPLEVDLSYEQFDPDVFYDLCAGWMADYDGPHLLPSTMLDDALPQGVLVTLATSAPVDVRTGPGEGYAPASFSLSGAGETRWIQALGVEDGWAMIRCRIDGIGERFGYVPVEALSAEAELPELGFVPRVAHFAGQLTDDPLWFSEPICDEQSAGAQVLATLDAIFGIEWLYVEVDAQGGEKLRGFCSPNNISFDFPFEDAPSL